METNFSYGNVQKLLIQALFNEQEVIPKISSFIGIDDFTDENYKTLYLALLSLNSEEIESKKKISISDLYEWSTLKNQIINPEIWPTLVFPTTESPFTLAEILKRLSVQNKARILLEETSSKLSYDSPQTLEIISEAESRLNDLSSSLIIKKDEKSHEESIDELLEYVYKEEPEEIDTIPLFNQSMSEILRNGWKQEQMIVVGARTGVGKSVFAVDSTVAACNANRSVLFFSLEMSKKEVHTRLLSVQSDVVLDKLKPGTLKSKEELDRIQTAGQQIKEWKLEVDDTPGQTIESIKAKSKLKAMSKEGLDMIVIDYLQLITPSNSYGKSRQDQVAEISREIKLLAKALRVPVMVLVQLKRANKSKEEVEDELPTLDEIRESGAIAQDADIVILIHRKKKEDETDPKATFIIDKNRAGKAPWTFKVRCVLEKSAFRDLTPSDLEESKEDDIDIKEFTEDNFKSNETFDSSPMPTDFENNMEIDDSIWDDLF